MIEQILVRFYEARHREMAEEICATIKAETALTALVVDHSNLSLEEFEIGGSTPVSIDRMLAERFNITYMRMSRIFREDGTIVGRKIVVPDGIDLDNICVIDTDIVAGNTIRNACHLLKTKKFSVPLVLNDVQDLIDVEDLIENISLLEDGSECTYLINKEFFMARTSLPEHMYARIRTITADWHYARTRWSNDTWKYGYFGPPSAQVRA